MQGTSRAIPTPGEAIEDWQILVRLGAALGLSLDYATDGDVRADIASRYAETAGLRRSEQPLFRATCCRQHVAAGLESVRAMEVGFHVSGSAASEGSRGPVSGSVDRLDSASGSEMRWVRGTRCGVRKLDVVRTFRSAAALALAVSTLAVSLRAQLGPPKAEVAPILETADVRPGSTVHAALQVHLPEGYHTNSNKPRDPNLIPISVTFDPPPEGITFTEVVFPPATDLAQRGADQPLRVFSGDFTIGVALAVGATVPSGSVKLPAMLRYQACDEVACYAPARAPIDVGSDSREG